MPTITVTLSESGSGETVTFRAPAPGVPAVVRQPGVTHLTAGGGIAQYKIGAANFEATLQISHLTNALKDSLEAFFRSHWGKSTVTYTDENSNAFTVRFLDDQLDPVKDARNAWAVALRLRLSAVLK